MKVLFAGTPAFAVAALQALSTEHEIVGAFTQPDRKSGRGKKLTPPPVKIAAEKLEIDVFQPSSLKNQQAAIRELEADIMAVVAYGMLLPQSILDIPPLGCINIHASILPRWRGAAPIQRAIEAGDDITGVSIMRMELGLDTGPVYQTLTAPIGPQDTSASLHDTLANLGAKGILSTLESLAQNPDLAARSQDETQANYAKKINKDEAIINWSMSAHQIDQKIRAFVPWPICQTQHAETRIRIFEASPSAKVSDKTPGQIIDVSEQIVEVACGNGVLELSKLQRDGSRALSVREFCNGYPLKPGDQLGGF